MVENTEEMHEKVVLRMDLLYLWSLSTNNRPLPRLPFASHFAHSAKDPEWWVIVEFISKPSKTVARASRDVEKKCRASTTPTARDTRSSCE